MLCCLVAAGEGPDFSGVLLTCPEESRKVDADRLELVEREGPGLFIPCLGQLVSACGARESNDLTDSKTPQVPHASASELPSYELASVWEVR